VAKRSRYTILFEGETQSFEATAHEAAKKAARLAARGTLKRSGSMWDQPENAKFPGKVKLLDEAGKTVMNCAPSIVSPSAARAGRAVRYSFSRCTITPTFKRQLRRRKRKGP